ncbi:leucine-rich repeat-containing protein 15-like [Euwallacea similis]|uniref:leucine-rich repeat-containing protein 15-like n=1 Tax=Euwallacea similis TaxID=1736056 RepID=UPI00344E7243
MRSKQITPLIILLFLKTMVANPDLSHQEENVEPNCIFLQDASILQCSGAKISMRDLALRIINQTTALHLKDVNRLLFHQDESLLNKSYEIRSLIISSCGDVSVEPFGLRQFSDLEYIEVTSSSWPVIWNDTFSGLEKLGNLVISSAGLSQLDRRSFGGLKNLVLLDLSNNSLSTIPPTAFADLNGLYELSLRQNRFEDLNPYPFSSLENLSVLHLSGNSLKTVDSFLFNALKQLEHLTLDNNNILTISGNLQMENLKFLSMVNNKLSHLDVDVFSGCKSLISMDLSKNNLTSVSEAHFVKLPHLKYLCLRGNKIPRERFREILQYTVLYCDLYQLTSIMISTVVPYLSYTNSSLPRAYLSSGTGK